LCFVLRKDILNHRDINCIFFFNNRFIFFIINIYPDKHQLALKYLKNTEVNIHNILIMTGNFNIRDRDWDLAYSYHLAYNNILMEIADFFNLRISSSVHQVPTCYADNTNNFHSVIDPMFLCSDSVKVNIHFILPEFQYPLDHFL